MISSDRLFAFVTNFTNRQIDQQWRFHSTFIDFQCVFITCDFSQSLFLFVPCYCNVDCFILFFSEPFFVVHCDSLNFFLKALQCPLRRSETGLKHAWSSLKKRPNQGFIDHGGFCDFLTMHLRYFWLHMTTYDYIIMLLESLWGLWTQICTIMVAQDKSMKAVRVLPSQEMQRRERIQKGFRFGNRFSLIFAIVCCSLLSYFVRQHAVIFTITWSIGICSFNIMNYHGLIFLIISNISFDVFLSRSRLFFCQHLSYDVF